MAPAPPILSTIWLSAGAKCLFLSINLLLNDEITGMSKTDGITHKGQICKQLLGKNLSLSWG
jgi:hypothetical protein